MVVPFVKTRFNLGPLPALNSGMFFWVKLLSSFTLVTNAIFVVANFVAPILKVVNELLGPSPSNPLDEKESLSYVLLEIVVEDTP